MIYSFMAFIFLLFIFVYSYNNNDVFSPSILLLFGYFTSVFFLILNRNKWYSDISFYTIFIIGLAILIFIIIDILNTIIIGKKRCSPINIKYIKVPFYKMLIVLIIGVLALFFLYRSIRQISGVTYGSLSFILSNYKQQYLETGSNFGYITNILVKISYAFSYIFLYFFISNYIANKALKRNIYNLIPVIIGVILTLLLSNRLTLILYFSFSIIAYSLIKNRQTGGIYKANIKTFFIICISIFCFLTIFFKLTEFIGRKSTYEFLDYISIYIGSSIPNLNNYLNSGIVNHGVHFYEIFPGFINSLHKIGVLPFSVTKVLEFRLISNFDYSNVYTGLRRYFNSGGVFGILFFQTIYASFFSHFYIQLKKNKDTQYLFGFKLIVYCKLVYTVALQAIEDHFFIDVFSIGYILETLILYYCYYFILKFRLKK